MLQMKAWRIAAVAGLGLLMGAIASRAAGERPPAYVWLFSATGADAESLADAVTEEFEEALVKAGCLPIVQRRNLPELESHQKQEVKIAVILETLSGATLANTSVRINRGKRFDAEERERRMTELASEMCGALGSTKNGSETGEPLPHPSSPQPRAERTCSTLRDEFKGEQKWWMSPTGG